MLPLTQHLTLKHFFGYESQWNQLYKRFTCTKGLSIVRGFCEILGLLENSVKDLKAIRIFIGLSRLCLFVRYLWGSSHRDSWIAVERQKHQSTQIEVVKNGERIERTSRAKQNEDYFSKGRMRKRGRGKTRRRQGAPTLFSLLPSVFNLCHKEEAEPHKPL